MPSFLEMSRRASKIIKKASSEDGKSLKNTRDLTSSETSKTLNAKSNVLIRTIFTVIMLATILSTLYLNKEYLFITVYIIKTLICSELIRMVKFPHKKIFFPTKYLVWYFKGVADIYFLGKNLMKIYPSKFSPYISENHLFFCFTMYITGIVFFVVSLEKKLLRVQFGQFALSHITIYMMNISMCLFMNNINNGKIWFIYPVILVAVNDIFAYIVGRNFGKTPLIKLSPKKTYEGFIGGFLFTIIIGFIICYLKSNYPIFEDKYDDVLMSIKDFNFLGISIKIKRLYIHGFSLILFASLIAPFGGFFASGLKRTFKIKDFGESIPGHGGFADRMDCQILMGIFVNVYFRTFILKKIYTPEKIYDLIVKNLNQEETLKLLQMLKTDYNR